MYPSPGLTHSQTLTHTHFLSLSHTLSLSQIHARKHTTLNKQTHTHSHTLYLSVLLSLSHTHTHTHISSSDLIYNEINQPDLYLSSSLYSTSLLNTYQKYYLQFNLTESQTVSEFKFLFILLKFVLTQTYFFVQPTINLLVKLALELTLYNSFALFFNAENESSYYENVDCFMSAIKAE